MAGCMKDDRPKTAILMVALAQIHDEIIDTVGQLETYGPNLTPHER
jgi:hypothetical protein